MSLHKLDNTRTNLETIFQYGAETCRKYPSFQFCVNFIQMFERFSSYFFQDLMKRRVEPSGKESKRVDFEVKMRRFSTLRTIYSLIKSSRPSGFEKTTVFRIVQASQMSVFHF